MENIEIKNEINNQQIIKYSRSITGGYKFVILTVVSVILFVLLLVYYLMEHDTLMLVLAVVEGLCSVVLVFFLILIPITSKKNNKQLGSLIKYDYTFSEDNFHVVYETDSNKGESEYNYSAIARLVIHSDHCFLFINNVNFYVIEKKDNDIAFDELIKYLKTIVNNKVIKEFK